LRNQEDRQTLTTFKGVVHLHTSPPKARTRMESKVLREDTLWLANQFCRIIQMDV
jgi:hypothetical protein